MVRAGERRARPCELSVAEIAQQVREGDLSPIELMESILRQVRRLEPLVKAWVTLHEERAMEAARQAERELEEMGPRSPLHGVPVGIKDIIYTAEINTTACSRVLANFVPQYDATVVARLKAAGAIILGKTVTTEFAHGDPPPTRNPWNLEYTPGGSSSGSAAAVGARMCPAALGSQTGGSTLRPAAYNGIVGLKPTYGRISLYGVIPLAWSLDTVGILVRSVEDAVLVLQAVAGHDPQDPSSSTEPVPDYLRALHRLDRPPRIGLVREFFFGQSEPEVRSHTQAVAESLARHGARVEEVRLPRSFDRVHEAQRILSCVEAAAFHRQMFQKRRNEYGPKVAAHIEAGIPIPAVDYVLAQRHRRQFLADMRATLVGWDALMTPAAPTPVPRDLTTTGAPVFQQPWTFSTLPAFAIPTGLSQAGMPLGIQLVGAPFGEGPLSAVAWWCERTLDVNLCPAMAA